MPAVSKKQQRFMGMVHAVQKGRMRAPSKRVAEVARSMKPSDAEEFARTKRKGLPERRRERGGYRAKKAAWEPLERFVRWMSEDVPNSKYVQDLLSDLDWRRGVKDLSIPGSAWDSKVVIDAHNRAPELVKGFRDEAARFLGKSKRLGALGGGGLAALSSWYDWLRARRDWKARRKADPDVSSLLAPRASEYAAQGLASGLGAAPGSAWLARELATWKLPIPEKLVSLKVPPVDSPAHVYQTVGQLNSDISQALRKTYKPSWRRAAVAAGLALLGYQLGRRLYQPSYRPAGSAQLPKNTIKVSSDQRSQVVVGLGQLYLRDLARYSEGLPPYLKRASENKLAALSRELDRRGSLSAAVKSAYADAPLHVQQRILVKLAKGFLSWMRRKTRAESPGDSEDEKTRQAPSYRELRRA